MSCKVEDGLPTPQIIVQTLLEGFRGRGMTRKHCDNVKGSRRTRAFDVTMQGRRQICKV